MDFPVQTGVNWIVAIQSAGGWLEAPMRFFTFLGSEEFIFLVLPLIGRSSGYGIPLRSGSKGNYSVSK